MPGSAENTGTAVKRRNRVCSVGSHVSQSACNKHTHTHRKGMSGQMQDQSVYMGGTQARQGGDCRIGEGLLPLGQPGKVKAVCVSGPMFE